MTTPLQAMPRKQNSEDSALVPTSFVYLSGSSSPGARAPKARSAGKRGDTRALKARSGGAAQRVRQKATRERRRSNDGVRKVAERTCVGCNGAGSATELLRVVLAPNVAAEEAASATPVTTQATGTQATGTQATAPLTAATDGPDVSGGEPNPSPSASRGGTVVVDLGGKLPGRGAWVHPQPACIERACNRGFAKAFAAPVRATSADVIAQIRAAAERRLAGLLLASARSRQLVYGRDAVKEVLGQTPLVILALDAQSVAKDGDLQRAGFEGKVMLWSTKAQLGHWLGRSEVGVVAITERSIADVMRKTIALASLASGPRGSVAAGSGRSVSSAVDDDTVEQDAASAASELEGDSVAGPSASESGASESGASGSGAVREEEWSEVR